VIRRPYGRAELSSALSLLLTTPVGAKAQADRNPSAVGISAVRSLRHDMNNPLSVVLGQVEILETDKRELPADVRRCLGEIRTAAEKVCDIILSVVLGQVEILEINNRELPADVCGRLGKIRMAAEQMRDTIVRSRSGDEEENENSEGDVAR
jgi:signal transduction histidine kinase